MMDPSRSTEFPSWGSASGAAGSGGGGTGGSDSGGGPSQPSGGSQPPPSSQAPASSQPSPPPSSLSLPPAKRRNSAGESGSAGAPGSGGGSSGGGGAGGAGDGYPSGYATGADGEAGDRGAPSGGGEAGGGGMMGPSGSFDGGGGGGGAVGWRMSKPPPVLRGGSIPAGPGGSGNGPANGLHPGFGAPGLTVVPGAGGSGGVGGGGGGGGAPHGRGQMQPPYAPSLPPPPVAPHQALYPYVDDQGDSASLRLPGPGVPPSSGSASGALTSVPLAQQLAASMSFVGPYHGEGIAGGHGQTGPLGPGRLPSGGGVGNGPMTGGGTYPPIMMAPGTANAGGDQTQGGLRYPSQVQQAEDVPPVGFGYHYGGQQMPQGFLVNHGGGVVGGGGEAPPGVPPAPVPVGTCSPATLLAPVHSAMAT